MFIFYHPLIFCKKTKITKRLLDASEEMLDLMKSDCTTMGGVAFGDFMSEQWNRRQRAGDIAGLKQLAA